MHGFESRRRCQFLFRDSVAGAAFGSGFLGRGYGAVWHTTKGCGECLNVLNLVGRRGSRAFQREADGLVGADPVGFTKEAGGNDQTFGDANGARSLMFLWASTESFEAKLAEGFEIPRGGNWEPALGFEPRTDGLQNRCSTTELCRRGWEAFTDGPRGQADDF